MRSASSQYSSYPHEVSFRRRAVSFLLALAANALLVLMLLQLAPAPSFLRPDRKPATFELLPEPRIAPPPARTQAKVKAEGGASRRVPVAKPAAAAAPKDAPPEPPLNMMIVSKDVLDATDLAMRTRNPANQVASGEDGSGGGTGSGTAEGPGRGPGGERLYRAEWYREPTSAEMAFYLPPRMPPTGWGVIACRTVPQFRVEDCREVDESPRGSGLARAVRQAAWQFRVRPPRVGGRLMVGAWVSIEYTFTQTEAKGAESGRP